MRDMLAVCQRIHHGSGVGSAYEAIGALAETGHVREARTEWAKAEEIIGDLNLPDALLLRERLRERLGERMSTT